MKYSIKEVLYKDCTIEAVGSGWFTWQEICDRCRMTINEFGEVLKLHPKIDVDETDLCVDCLRFLLDNDLVYDKYTKKDYDRAKWFK